MSRKKKRLTFDFETRSEVDLKKVGGIKYSQSPTTRPTCLAFKIHGERKVHFLDFYQIMKPFKQQPKELQQLWIACIVNGFEFSAHNALFERAIYTNVMHKRLGWPLIPPRQYRCTAAKAAACALPRNLADAGMAMRLTTQKDYRGGAAVRATMQPTRQYRDWVKAVAEVAAGKKVGHKKQEIAAGAAPPKFATPETHPDVFSVLYEYCKIDVIAEELLDDSLPDLIPDEQELWHFNQKLNWRGLKIDIPTARKVVGIMEIENKKRVKDLDRLTLGTIQKPNSRNEIMQFLASEGVKLDNLRAKTVDDALKTSISSDAKQILEIRKALSMTSTKKYEGFLMRANDDEKVRDILLYHGASTGRDTGTGVQPHNFPRGLIKVDKDNPYEAINDVIEYDADSLKMFYGENLAILFSSVLRNMIMPESDHDMFVADFSKIEVAVLWWLADNKPGLRALLAGKDPYIYQAVANTGKTYEEIEIGIKNDERWAVDARQLGKAQILGGGFGMGAPKFRTTAWDMYRIKLTEKQSKVAIESYRKANARVPILWKLYEKAAIAAVERSVKISVGKCKFFCKDDFLWVELPSGRRLAYRDPHIIWRQTEWGHQQKTLQFWGVNSKTKKWDIERTWGGTLTENIVQATARDIMMPAMLRLEHRGYQGLLMVHDEGITQCPAGKGNVKEFVSIMCEKPKWADWWLPLEASGWRGERYRK